MSKVIRVPVLNSEYSVIFTYGTHEELKKVLKKYKYPMDKINSYKSNSRGMCFNDKGVYPVISMPRPPQTPEEMGTLAHEAVHAVDDIWNKIGETGGGEVYAHCVGAVVRDILTRLGKNNACLVNTSDNTREVA